MLFIFFIIVALAIIVYSIAGAAIIYHLKKYGIEGDLTPKMTWLFIIVSTGFILGLIFLFLGTPWKTII